MTPAPRRPIRATTRRRRLHSRHRHEAAPGARSRQRATDGSGSTAPRSTRVRATVVHGTPSTAVTQRGWRSASRCTRTAPSSGDRSRVVVISTTGGTGVPQPVQVGRPTGATPPPPARRRAPRRAAAAAAMPPPRRRDTRCRARGSIGRPRDDAGFADGRKATRLRLSFGDESVLALCRPTRVEIRSVHGPRAHHGGTTPTSAAVLGTLRSEYVHRSVPRATTRAGGAIRWGWWLRILGVVDREPVGTPVGRRVFLGLVGIGAVGVVFGARHPGLARAQRRPVHRQGRDRACRRSCRSAGSASTRSPATFPSRSRKAVPPAGRRASSTGPLDLTFDDLTGDDRRRSCTRDFQCVTGWRVPDVDVDGRAPRRPPRPRRRAARRRRPCASRPSTAPTPRASRSSQARRDDVIVAYELEGEPLSARRTVVRSGSTSRRCTATSRCKWLDAHRAHRATSSPATGSDYGYDVDGWVGRSNGRDDEPT